jgi:predicted metal-dependent hydrolase
MESSTPVHIDITPRQPNFDFRGVPSYWMADEITTHFMNALSLLIPYSERTVSEILRANMSRIANPELKIDIQNMIKQEGRHAAMHRKVNLRLEHGYKGLNFIGKIQKSVITAIRKLSSNRFDLATPVIFEHFTSAISRDILSKQTQWIGDNKNSAVDFTLWHCLEELEHQSVCYDVYKALVKHPFSLVLAVIFWLPITAMSIYSVQLFLMHKDRSLYRPKHWIGYLRFVIRTLPLFFKGTPNLCRANYQSWKDSDTDLYEENLKQYNQHK